VYLYIGIGVLIYRNWCTYISELVYLYRAKALLYKAFLSLKNY